MWIDFNNLEINDLQPVTDFEIKVVEFLQSWFFDDSDIWVQTSGSTGLPKRFKVQKDKMINSAKATCDFLNIVEGDSALLSLPIEYISGKMMLVRAMVKKLRLWVTEPTLKPLTDFNSTIDFCALTPLQVEHSLLHLHKVKKLIIGGASVSNELLRKIERIGVHQRQYPLIYETYGMSETLSHIALKELYPNKAKVFTLLDHIAITNDERGCLVINAEKISDSIIITNDLVNIINDRQFEYLGRVDHVINTGGAKVYPEQLESIIKNELANELVVLGVPDDVFGQKIVIVIESDDTNRTELQEKLKDIPFEKSYQKPKDLFLLNKLHRTPNGKIDRIAILKHIMNIYNEKD